jgi:hypothetical protein
MLKPVTADVSEFGAAMLPVPEKSVHVPTPTTAMFPENVELNELHKF